jgi:hypothetical protein
MNCAGETHRSFDSRSFRYAQLALAQDDNLFLNGCGAAKAVPFQSTQSKLHVPNHQLAVQHVMHGINEHELRAYVKVILV